MADHDAENVHVDDARRMIALGKTPALMTVHGLLHHIAEQRVAFDLAILERDDALAAVSYARSYCSRPSGMCLPKEVHDA